VPGEKKVPGGPTIGYSPFGGNMADDGALQQ
jgi:hypothetical protein